MASEQSSTRKPRSYYVDYTKRGGRNNRGRGGRGYTTNSNVRFPEISFGLRGFLITSIDEIKSYLETRNIFEGYYEEVYKMDQDKKQVESEYVMAEDELESELNKLRVKWPFKQVKTHCKNSVFITIQPDFSQIDPILLVDKFFNEILESRQIKTSNTFKVMPILDTFRCTPACAKESIINILQTIFKEEVGPKNYFIEFQSRGNYKLDSEDKQKIIDSVANAIGDIRPQWTVSRENADYMIVLIALRDVCCITVLKDYFKRCKYNVVELTKDFAPQEKQSNEIIETGNREEL